MNYLLDTHTLIWSLIDESQLSAKVKRILQDTQYNILVSTVSLWEISLKYALGKLELQGFSPEELPEYIVETGFELISLLPDESATFHNLKANWHRDPFDRMLIWQAVQQDYVLITKDKDIKKYQSIGLKLFW